MFGDGAVGHDGRAHTGAKRGDAGAQRLEKRLTGVAAGLERQREEFVDSLERRLGDMESELRRRLQALVAETDSERTVLETRLSELSRRVDELLPRSRESLGARAG